MTNELFGNGGYTLDYFQFYNWGTFNNKIFTLDAANKSTVLIGDNGTGKTTIVDAFLTLLVPTDKRYYNQSSGETSKKDRSEETYVLGAYGNKLSDKEDGGRYELQDYHRKKENTISILSGCFTNEYENRSYTLTQIRYYSTSNIVQVYAITEGKFTIEEMQATLQNENVELIKNRKWKDVLNEKMGTVFYPNFKQYASAFQTFFGLRSDKALKLFSQIVGLKVLGNIDEFVRVNMLEEGNILKEYENLLDNYETLLHCSNEIKKTKVQIEKFNGVYENGIKYNEEKDKKTHLELLNSTVPYFYKKYANVFLSEQLEELNKKLKKATNDKEKVIEEIDKLDREIFSITKSIANDSNKIRLDEIEIAIKDFTKEREIRKVRSDNYNSYITPLKLLPPKNEAQFEDNYEKIKARDEKEKNKENENNDKKRLILNEADIINKQLKEIQDELKSLGERDSNIPQFNINMRDNICRGIKCKSEDIPFIGELLQVKKEEENWKEAIEKVLHNVALTLIVPNKLYKKVSNYVNENDMKGRIVYLQAEQDAFSFVDEDVTFENNTIGSKLDYKESNENISFLKQYIKKHFSYICAQDINEYANSNKAVTINGLIKSGLKNEKDDRAGHKGRTNWVLGWSNKEKREALSIEIEDLMTRAQDNIKQKEKIEEAIIENRRFEENCHDALQIDVYDQIDVLSIVEKIEKENKEKEELLKNNQSLRKLEEELKEKTDEKKQRDEYKSKLDQDIGKYNNDIEKTQSEKDEINSSSLELSNESEENIKALEAYFPRLSKPKNYIDLKNNKKQIQTNLEESISASSKRFNGLTVGLTNSMNEAINPSNKIREEYGDWSIEFPDLKASVEYLDDFNKVYNRLIKDDLPRYTKQFHEYLHTSLQDDFTNFQGCIKNQQDDIQKAIGYLNNELKRITYSQNPDTFLKLEMNTKSDVDIRKFTKLLNDARPNAFDLALNESDKEEQQFEKIKLLLTTLNNDERFKKKVLDVRNWYTYGAIEEFRESGEQAHYYNSSSNISGGEKTKLTYTILGAAIAYQFGIAANDGNKPSFRFVIIDEAFSKIDPKNSVKVMEILKELEIQVMAVTPVNNISIIEDFINSIHYTEKDSNALSVVHHLSIREFEEQKDDIVRRTEEKS